MNPILLIDGYKLDHRRQYPGGTQRVYSNGTFRSSRVPGQDSVVFFGLQYFIKRYLLQAFDEEFFDQPRKQVLDEYARVVNGYLGPNGVGVEHIGALHDLGYLPLEIRALPEGTLVPLRVPAFTIENTHDDFAWLTNYVETLMSNILWLPSTSATTAFRTRRMLTQYAHRTGGDRNFVPWQGHDFSMRGMAGVEAACLSGAGHLLSFTGTDTIPALEFLEVYYGAKGLVGGSVPATEHSVMCAGGSGTDDEFKTFGRLLDLYPSGIVSVVSDTWDLWNVLTNVIPFLKPQIMKRDGKLVIRPDSGDPVKVLCGDPWAKNPAAQKGVIQLLWETFGGSLTSMGYKQLDPHVGAIYGDAITYERAQEICDKLEASGFASTNVVFGIGSFNYQYVTRDTYGFAMKATWAKINGEGVDLFKKPATDDGVKNSAKGRLAVLRTHGDVGKLYCAEQATEQEQKDSLLEPVYRDGILYRTQTLDDIRQRLAIAR